MIKNLARNIQKHKDFLVGKEKWLLGIKVRVPQRDIYPFDESFQNPAKALEERLHALKPTLEVNSDFIPSIMHNRMVWTIPSMFGCKMPLINDEPWATPIITDIKQVWDIREPDMNSGVLPKVIELLAYFKKNAPDGIPVTPPSEHTPLNIAYMLRGSDLFTDLYDHPEEVKQLLQLITNTFIKVEYCYKKVLQEETKYRITFAGFYISGLRIAGDCNVNLSPDFIREFEIPYLERIANIFGDLMIHYCGANVNSGHQVANVMAQYSFIKVIHTQLAPFFTQNEENIVQYPFKLISIWEIPDLEKFIDKNINKIKRIGQLGFFVEVNSVEEGKDLIKKWPHIKES